MSGNTEHPRNFIHPTNPDHVINEVPFPEAQLSTGNDSDADCRESPLDFGAQYAHTQHRSPDYSRYP